MRRYPPPFTLQDRYVTARAFLEAIENYWGRHCYQLSADRKLALVRCPVCRPPSRDWHDWSFVVAECEGGWTHIAWCGCPDAAVAAELLKPALHRLELEVQELENRAWQ